MYVLKNMRAGRNYVLNLKVYIKSSFYKELNTTFDVIRIFDESKNIICTRFGPKKVLSRKIHVQLLWWYALWSRFKITFTEICIIIYYVNFSCLDLFLVSGSKGYLNIDWSVVEEARHSSLPIYYNVSLCSSRNYPRACKSVYTVCLARYQYRNHSAKGVFYLLFCCLFYFLS